MIFGQNGQPRKITVPGLSRGMGIGTTWLLSIFLSACMTVAPAAVTPSPTASPTVTLTPTATIDWFPATATPTRPPTQAAVSDAEELAVGKGETLLTDDFSDTTLWETGQTTGGSVEYGKNELTLALSGAKATVSSRRSQTDFRDFYLEITAQPSMCRGEDNYGLILRSASNSDFYRLAVSCSGMVRMERISGGFVSVIKNWTQGYARPDVQRLAVWVYGNDFRFFIDDVLQLSVHDPVLDRGQIGVFARSSGENALTVNFSDLVVSEIDPDAVAAAATPTPTPTPGPTQKSAAP